MQSKYNSPLTPRETQEIVEHLLRGQIGLFPTDTVYGLGCMANNAVGTATIYRLKGRPVDRTLPLLIGSWDQFERYSEGLKGGYSKRLAELWPGALTVVVKASRAGKALSFHCLKDDTIALRMPDHTHLRYLIEQVKTPLAATSANLSGGVEALTLGMVTQSVRTQVDWTWSEIIPHEKPIPSTVVDLTSGEPVVLRQGQVVF
jgi:tRNA threonylcarbamoyl adenosine modification protein (Sua5/YciO/YrdC/YwlC family)